MAVIFTDEQRQAIDTRDRTLLVSAAAGSGKTATLTERIISSLLDAEHPSSLSRLLVVTFTKASAADVRAKISEALTRAQEADPENRHLERQRLLLPSARISTINSLCNRILRQNAEAVGLSPSYRIADEAEAALLYDQVMEELLCDLYAGECEGIEAREFFELSDTVTSAKSEDSLGAVLRELYESLLPDVRGLEALCEARALYTAERDKPFLETVFGREVATELASALSDIAALEREYADHLVGSDEPSLKKRIPYARSEAELLERISGGLLAADPTVLPLLRERRPSFPAARGEISDENKFLHALHKRAVKLMGDASDAYFSYPAADLPALFDRLAGLADLLYRILSLYDARLTAEKRRRRICDFSDTERLVYDLLIKDGEPTALARELSLELDAIYIDEFQDVNAVQYGIFRALSRKDNLFMVGDVKQSIYSFRYADPSIFSALRAEYPPLTDAPGTAASVFFTRNFRCDRPIIDYTNRVAGTLFRHASRTFSYAVQDDLAFSKPAPTGLEPVRTAVFERRYSLPKGEEAAAAEAAYVAKEISHLLSFGRKNNGEPYRPSDIVLLFRSRTAMPVFRAALSGIAKVHTDADGEYFLNPEVLLALALLNTVNNPRRDIYLAATLRSPVFGVTLDELIAIRRESPDAPTLYDALLAYLAGHPDFIKGQRFADRLAGWRRVAEGETVGRLLLTILHEAGLLTLSGEGSEHHHDNLYRLYEYARSFEASSYQGLYSFISYINTAIEAKKTILRPTSEGGEDAIRFMTVHSSKGLEFPVCFVVGTDRAFHDRTPELLYDRAYGPAASLLSGDGTVRVRNPVRNLLSHRARLSGAEEEIRLLYVALTRARERLYVTGTTTSLDKKCEEAPELTGILRPFSILERRSWLQWILPLRLLANDPYLSLYPLPEGEDKAPTEPFAPIAGGTEEGEPLPPPEEGEVARLARELSRRFSFVYPDLALTALPEKLSVSRLSPAVLDGADEGDAVPSAVPEEFVPSVPAFLSGVHRDEAALSGTATHLFLQFCDFSRLARDGVDAELVRLGDEEFLSAEDIGRVRRDEIEAFCRSALFARLLAAHTLRRELRFHALLPAADFTDDPERQSALAERTLLVQGVIDCILEEEGGYTLVDYKTDRLSPYELSHPEAAAATLTKRHRDQLAYYAAACHRMYGTPPREVLIYSLALGDAVRVEL